MGGRKLCPVRAPAPSRDGDEEVLSTIADSLVPAVADWVSVTVRDPDGGLRRVAVVHADPSCADACAELAARDPVDLEGVVGPTTSARDRRPRVYEDVTDELLDRSGVDAAAVALYRRLGCRSAASVPLVAGDRVVGGLALVQGPSGRRFTDADVPSLEALARRCAMAVDAAELRRSVEEAARERDASLAVLDTLLATAPVAMALVGADLGLVRLNDAFAAIAACERTECTGRRIDELLPDLAPRLVPALATAAVGRPVTGVELVGPPGSPLAGRVWMASAYPVPGGDGPAPAGVVLVEVTAERAASAELRRRAAQQTAVAELGQRALAGAGLDELAAEAARLQEELAGGDVAFASAVEATLGAAAARQRAEDELRESRRRLVLALEAGGMGSWEWDLGSGELRWAESLSTAIGVGLGAEHPVTAVLDVVHPDDRDALVAQVTGAVEEGGSYHAVFRVVTPEGGVRWVESRGTVVPGGDGSAGRVVGVAMDVTDRRRVEELRQQALDRERTARLEAEAARERLAFLAAASAALGGSLDAHDLYATLAGLAVPRLADWCVVDAVDDAGRLRQAAIAHRDPGVVALVVESRRRGDRAGGDALWDVRRVAASGRAELIDGVDDERLRAVADDDEHLALLRRLDPRSAVVAPLVARGRVVGVLTLVAVGGDRRYGPDDLALAEELASRAAVAVDNALLFEERSRVAATLQRSLLPPALPDVPGVDVAARYRPASSGADISGDFYDVFETAGGAWAAVIGDVCGKGPAAAALTGLFRHSVRAAAVREPSPRRILRAVNEALLVQVDDTKFGSAAFVRLEPGDGTAAVTVASAGHPLPVIVRADGTVEEVPCAGTVLGVVADPWMEERSDVLRPGDAIVLYTDGVVEARRGTELFGDERLLAVLAGVAGRSAGEVAEAVDAAAVAFRGDAPDDDVAVLVLRMT